MTTPPEQLDRFLDALGENPDAIPPADLNADLAEFARRLIKSQKTNSVPGIKARVWQKSLVAASQAVTQNGEKDMNVLPVPQSPIRNSARMFSYVTALAAMIGLIVVLGASFNSLNRSHLAGIAVATNAATSTPVPIVPLVLGQTTTGKLTSNSSKFRYHIKATETGLLKVSAYSEAFKVRLSYNFDNPEQVDPNAQLSAYSTATNKEITMLAHVSAGAELTLTVSSEMGHDTGDFSLGANFGKETTLELGKPVDRWITVAPDKIPELQYFTFEARAGAWVDVRVESDQNQDLTLFMQNAPGSAKNTSYSAINFITDMPYGCRHSYYVQRLQCYDDDSGSGSDPELHHILIREDGRYDLIVSSVVNASLASHYTISYSSRVTTSLSPGSRVFTMLSWKDSALPFFFRGYAGKPITFKVDRLGGDQSLIRLTTMQNNETLNSYPFTTSESSTTQTITPKADGMVILFVEYAQPIEQDAVTPFSVEQLTP